MGWFKGNVAANHVMELCSNDGNVDSYYGQQEISNYYGTTMEVLWNYHGFMFGHFWLENQWSGMLF